MLDWLHAPIVGILAVAAAALGILAYATAPSTATVLIGSLLLGASIGAWRMTAACLRDPDAALARLAEDYITQDYEHALGKPPTAAVVSQAFGAKLVEHFGGREAEVLQHPRHPYTRRLLAAVPTPDPGARRHSALIEGEIPSPIRGVGDEPALLSLTEVSPGHLVAGEVMTADLVTS